MRWVFPHAACPRPLVVVWCAPGADDVPVISDACREEIYQYKINRNANINKNVKLGGWRG